MAAALPRRSASSSAARVANNDGSCEASSKGRNGVRWCCETADTQAPAAKTATKATAATALWHFEIRMEMIFVAGVRLDEISGGTTIHLQSCQFRFESWT